MKYSKLPENIASRLLLGEQVFDSLPEEVQQAMVDTIRRALETEIELEKARPIVEEYEKKKK